MNRSLRSRLVSHELPRSLVVFAVLAIATLLTVAAPILVYGFPEGGYDQPQHLRFAITFHDSIASEISLPQWGDDSLGFGSVGVRFYPPLASLTASAAYAFSGSWLTALTLSLLFWMFVGSLGVYLFCREWVDPNYALVGGLLFTIAPYHLLQVYQYFLFAEFIALSIVPFCFLFLSRLARSGKWNDGILFGISYSLLTLAHIPTGLIALMLFPLFTLLLADLKRWTSLLSALGVGVLTWALLTGFYFQRVLGEFSWVAHTDGNFSSGVYSFSSWLFPNFVTSRNLIDSEILSVLLDVSVAFAFICLVPGLIFFLVSFRKKAGSDRTILGALGICGLASILMLSRPSEPLWNVLPLLERIQFPFRWMTVASFLAVASFAIVLPLLVGERRQFLRPVVYSSLALFLLLGLFDYTQVITQIVPINEEKFNSRISELPSHTDNYPWWPVWAKRQAFGNLEKVSGVGTVEISKWDATEKEFAVSGVSAGTLRVATFFYPYWKASVNGSEVPVEKNEDGTISIPVGVETSTVRLFFEEPPYYTVMNWVSGTAWLIVGLSVAFSFAFALWRRRMSLMQIPSAEVRYAD